MAKSESRRTALRYPPAWLEMLCVALLLGAAAGEDADAQSAAEATSEQVRYFESHVRPLLAENCVACHGAKKQEGGLRLDSRASMVAGGDSGPAIDFDDWSDSLILSAVRYESFEMPPKGPLVDDQIRHLAVWIQQGATWPSHAAPIRPAQGQITDQDREWWAFRPVERVTPPTLIADATDANEVDAFIHARLRARQLRPAAAADRTQLIRRLYLNIIGLPPRPEDVDAFLSDSSPNAYERVVDQLLRDPRYGEHWAAFWLDVVRYAESDGWNKDSYRPDAWRYRDYVVNAFNSDLPFPQFVREQLAGDELDTPTPDSLAATGFLRLGIFEYNQRNARQHWTDIVNEMTDVTGDVFFGLGMACARCHDHKYDPILQHDYFRLRAFFAPLLFDDEATYANAETRLAFKNKQQRWLDATQDIRRQIEAIERPYKVRKRSATVDKFPLDIQASYFKDPDHRSSWDQQMFYLVDRQFYEEGADPLAKMSAEDKQRHEELWARLDALQDLEPRPLPKLMAVRNHSGAVAPTQVPDSATVIEPGFLAVLESDSIEPSATQRKPRTALADWIVSPENPLTARVIVNRIWQQHFGRGLAPNASDLGALGGGPSHPQLLDWLASRFMEEGWRIKWLQKQILMSATWRQATEHDAETVCLAEDGQNELLWRRPVKRLTAEQVRDAILWASGSLSSQRGGPSVSGKAPRRSIYVKRIRNTPDPFLHSFDASNGLKSISKRPATTTPVQALLMLNGEFVLDQAEKMATRLAKIPNARERVQRAMRIAWTRQPTPAEITQATAFVTADDPDLAQQNLVDFCHLLLNSNEFLYVD